MQRSQFTTQPHPQPINISAPGQEVIDVRSAYASASVSNESAPSPEIALSLNGFHVLFGKQADLSATWIEQIIVEQHSCKIPLASCDSVCSCAGLLLRYLVHRHLKIAEEMHNHCPTWNIFWEKFSSTSVGKTGLDEVVICTFVSAGCLVGVTRMVLPNNCSLLCSL